MIATRIANAFAAQAVSCEALGSPFMAQLMGLFATRDWPDGPITDLIANWPGDASSRGASVPLRLAGGLHALRLRGNPRLAAVYPPHQPRDTDLWDAVTDTMQDEHIFLADWMQSAPQTNEVRRAALLIAVGHLLAAEYGLPISTSELGASGGLNLKWDQYALQIGDQRFGPDHAALTLAPDWKGPLPPATPPQVAMRVGVDLNPLNPQNPDDALRLRAYLWPDQPHRMALTEAAIAAAGTRVDKDDAVDWLRSRLTPKPGHLHLIYHTVAWQYFPAEKQAEGEAAILAAGRAATADAPIAWFGMEADDQADGAKLTLRTFPDGKTWDLGRADFHGRWVNWAGLKHKGA